MERMFQVPMLAGMSSLAVLVLRCNSPWANALIIAKGSVLVRRFVKASQLLGELGGDLR